ncbi:uncharacterized protein LY89DRAFT_682401 [Mollisia scopiformis]|uniref:Secreted protein n=1 Tax=Mollisia scopiformis TaxID=149040 RepID=A0A194XKG2_MOLSC|nr:uncharacterized protein LY89DRAFT_682401 [Mollisia scopiformis]KUJ20700.1 hypothetical protein LY89DRAFT_682401 [Mollisia scopiformis]
MCRSESCSLLLISYLCWCWCWDENAMTVLHRARTGYATTKKRGPGGQLTAEIIAMPLDFTTIRPS